ncbi:MAG: monovalent cation/H+ antiporter complex subunit F [Thermomicrobiales bacterium]
MHSIVFAAAAIWMTVLLAATVVLAIRARLAAERILAIDALTLVLVALLVLYAAAIRQPYYLDAALALALVSFVGTVAAARRLAAGRVL